MMLERKAYKRLLKWKNEMPQKALLVDGARQVGKTFLIEEFARREFSSYVKVDFLRDEGAVATFAEVTGAQDLVERLTLAAGTAVEPGRTLVFLDEVQEAPNVITLSKYIVQDARFPLVMSGSLLGVELRRVKSLPVGFAHIENMFPLDFEEFCISQGVSASLWNRMRNAFEAKEPLEDALHERLVRLFRIFMVVGGMPDAVQAYIDGAGDLGAARDIQDDLVRLYRDDISKYAGSRALQVKSIFDAIPNQLNKENKRFELKSLRSKAQYERYANDFAWLVSAGAVLKTNNVTEPRYMLSRTEEPNRFKLYSSDTGMLFRQYPVEAALDAVAGARAVNFGGVYENAVAQELASAHVPLRYYHHSRRGEVDFLAEVGDGGVVAIEVKSGKDYKLHTALNTLLGTEEYGVECAYVLSEANISVGERAGKPVYYVPLYLAPFVIEGLVPEHVGSESEAARLAKAGRTLTVDPPDLSAWN